MKNNTQKSATSNNHGFKSLGKFKAQNKNLKTAHFLYNTEAIKAKALALKDKQSFADVLKQGTMVSFKTKLSIEKLKSLYEKQKLECLLIEVNGRMY